MNFQISAFAPTVLMVGPNRATTSLNITVFDRSMRPRYSSGFRITLVTSAVLIVSLVKVISYSIPSMTSAS